MTCTGMVQGFVAFLFCSDVHLFVVLSWGKLRLNTLGAVSNAVGNLD